MCQPPVYLSSYFSYALEFYLRVNFPSDYPYSDFFSIFNLNPAVGVMKESEHLLSATEVATCRSGVKIFHMKMLNAQIS